MKHTAYDLIVVGTGFASTFFLYQYLAKRPATEKILVLERGYPVPWAERVKEKRGEETAYTGQNPDWRSTFVNKQPRKDWMFTLGFGGSSHCWYACTPRFLPNDFRMKTLYGVGNDWPVQYEELDPYYEQVEDIMAVSGPADTPFPRKKAYAQPPHLFTEVDKLLHKKYGNLYINQPTARARVAMNGRNPCCASGVCSVCPVNAKFTIDNSNMGVYEDPRVELLTGAQVYGLELVQDRVRKVSFRRDNHDYHVAGEVVALGANALFNANILLNSGDTNAFTGQGLGEQLGLQAHVYLDKLENVGGSTWVNANGYMLYDGDHRREAAACLIESSNAPFFRPESGKWRQMASFRMVFEDLPTPENYVTTSDDVMQPAVFFGGPSAYAQRGIERMKQQLPEILSCLPVEKIIYNDPYATEAHILGTARMGTSAQDSVVDKHLRHHQYRNLFVLGASSFTTYTPANPTLTLSALSLLAADQSFSSTHSAT
ncbi:GMC family oxidoreductase [Hymenobacter aerilatus]|uniref:GMC family oxidoreductase n=1 Tax=Hymenobacter aerilatus TaxID=2932251 RepID=A0A8T9SWU9_9BACT|nr:GMC family oxidoreductase [Hymenobacter aerilatus]UOR06568.1 GMC family oxidoreductase [Hymenobacter aerilatus]